MDGLGRLNGGLSGEADPGLNAADLFMFLSEAQASLRKPRRPVAEQMLSIQVRDVRPLVLLVATTAELHVTATDKAKMAV